MNFALRFVDKFEQFILIKPTKVIRERKQDTRYTLDCGGQSYAYSSLIIISCIPPKLLCPILFFSYRRSASYMYHPLRKVCNLPTVLTVKYGAVYTWKIGSDDPLQK